MQSPKARYQLSLQDVQWHQRLVSSIEFERAADAAMLHCTNNATKIEEVIGARNFLKMFVELSNLPKPSEKSAKPEITYS